MAWKRLNLLAGQGDPACVIYSIPLVFAVLALVGGNTVRTLGLIGCCLANVFTMIELEFGKTLLRLFRNRAWRAIHEFMALFIILAPHYGYSPSMLLYKAHFGHNGYWCIHHIYFACAT